MKLSPLTLISFWKILWFSIITLVLFGCTSSEEVSITSQDAEIEILDNGKSYKEPLEIKGDLLFYWKQWPIDTQGNFDSSLLKEGETFSWDKAAWTDNGHPSKGYGTFRFSVKNEYASQQIVFNAPSVFGACEVWINGKKVVTHGKLSLNGEGEEIDGRPLNFVFPQEKDLDIIVMMSNHKYALGGGFPLKNTLQEKDNFFIQKKRNTVIESAFTFIILLLGIYQISAFFVLKKPKYFLFLGFFCLAGATRLFFGQESIIYNFIPDISIETVARVRRFCFYIALTSILFYYDTLFPKYLSKKVIWILLIVLFIGGITTLFGTVYILTLIFPYFQLIGLVVTVVIFYQIINAVRDKKPFALAMLISTVISALMFSNNVLNDLHIIRTKLLIGELLLSYIVIQGYLNYRVYKDNEKAVSGMRMKINDMQKEVENNKSEISKLLHESYHHIKSKEKLVDNLKEVVSKGDDNSIKGIIDNLRTELIDDTQLNSIRNEIEMLNYDFSRRLKQKHPDLSATDLEICSYFRIGLNRKEIARLRYTSIEAVKKSRHRLRKKLDLIGGDLDGYLKSF